MESSKHPKVYRYSLGFHVLMSTTSSLRAPEVFLNRLEANDPELHDLSLDGWAQLLKNGEKLLTALGKHDHLKILSLAACHLGDTGVETILSPLLRSGRLPELKRLDLSGNGITNKGAQILAGSLCHHGRIEELVLSWNAIGDDGLLALSKAVRSIQCLRVLELDGIHFDGRGGGGMNPDLGTDQLSDRSSCNIGDKGCLALANALPESRLECLLLSRQTEITAKGICSLSSALKSSCVKHLQLQRIPVDDDGIVALSCSLSQLELLDLTINNISNRGAYSLAQAISHSDSLVSIGLTRNNIGVEGLTKLVDAVAINISLIRFEMYASAAARKGATFARKLKPFLRLNRSTKRIRQTNRKDLLAHALARAADMNNPTRLYRTLRVSMG